MKPSVYTLLLLSLLLLGCAQQRQEPQADTAETQVTFSAELPDYSILRSEEESKISRLELWVFDKEGLFLQRAVANVIDAGSGVYHFTATINKSSEERIIHFVANYQLTAELENQWKGRHEGGVIPALRMTESDLIAMWIRKEYTGIRENQDLGQLQLLRNKGKISLEIATAQLTDVSFLLFNNNSTGSIAPFRGGVFDTDALTPVTTEVNAGHESAFVSADQPIYAYEHSNQITTSSVSSYPYMIIRCKFVGHEALGYRYFKLDLVNTTTLTRFDIKRNHWLKVKIKHVKDVPNVGHMSLAEARRALPDNNFALSEEMQQYPSFSDGEGVVQVDGTTHVVFNGTTSLKIQCQYFPDKANPSTNNSKLKVERLTPSDGIITNADMANDGMLTVTIASGLNTTGRTLRSDVIVKVEGKPDLQRLIHIYVRDPYRYVSVKANGVTSAPTVGVDELECTVNKAQESTLDIELALPADLSTSLLPIFIRCYTENFYPVSGGMALGFDAEKTFYVYQLSQIPGDRKISMRFKSNKAESAETILLRTQEVALTDFKVKVVNP